MHVSWLCSASTPLPWSSLHTLYCNVGLHFTSLHVLLLNDCVVEFIFQLSGVRTVATSSNETNIPTSSSGDADNDEDDTNPRKRIRVGEEDARWYLLLILDCVEYRKTQTTWMETLEQKQLEWKHLNSLISASEVIMQLSGNRITYIS